MENEIKAAQALGFGRNRTRCLDLTTSRGTDGELRVEGSTSHAVIGDDGRPRRIPKEFREAARRVGASPPES